MQMGEEQVVTRINLISKTTTKKYNSGICWYIEMIPSFVLNRYSDVNNVTWLFLHHQTLVVKTVGIRERTEKSGERKKYNADIYIHFVRKCLRSYNLKFWHGKGSSKNINSITE